MQVLVRYFCTVPEGATALRGVRRIHNFPFELTFVSPGGAVGDTRFSGYVVLEAGEASSVAPAGLRAALMAPIEDSKSDPSGLPGVGDFEEFPDFKAEPMLTEVISRGHVVIAHDPKYGAPDPERLRIPIHESLTLLHECGDVEYYET